MDFTRTLRRHMAALLAAWLTVTPAWAAAPNVRPPSPTPIRDALPAIARTHASGLTQATPAPRDSCAKKLVLLTVAGAAVGGGSMLVLLAANNGSDSARALLTGWTLVGAGVGALTGAILCAI